MSWDPTVLWQYMGKIFTVICSKLPPGKEVGQDVIFAWNVYNCYMYVKNCTNKPDISGNESQGRVPSPSRT